MPRDATIVAVVRDEHVVMPRGDTVFETGDEVLALVTPDSEDADAPHPHRRLILNLGSLAQSRSRSRSLA